MIFSGKHFLKSKELHRYYYLYYSGWAAITKYRRLSGLRNRNLFSLSSEGWNSKIRVPAWSVSDETLPLWFWVPAFRCVLT